MKKRIEYIGLLFFTLIIIQFSYLIFYIPEVLPQKWESEKYNGIWDSYAFDYESDDTQYLDISPYKNTETIIYKDGYLYASADGGKIIRLREDGSDLTEVVNTNGAIVGFAFDHNDNIVFADAAYDSNGGAICLAEKSTDYQVTPLVTEYNNNRIMFPDAIAIDSLGNIYFTDACKISAAHHSRSTAFASNIDHIAHTKSGKLYVYSPQSQKVEYIAGGFSFANGITLSDDEKYIFLSETTEYRIWKIEITLREAMAGDVGTQVLIDDLPGFPDNLSKGADGCIWIGIVSSRSDLLDSISQDTLSRKILLNLPETLLSFIMNSEKCSHIMAISESGEVLSSCYTAGSEYTNITGVCETVNELYLESLCGMDKIAYIHKEDIVEAKEVYQGCDIQ